MLRLQNSLISNNPESAEQLCDMSNYWYLKPLLTSNYSFLDATQDFALYSLNTLKST
jgi:hypothetical protein